MTHETQFLVNLYHKFDIVVFEVQQGEEYICLTPPPSWLLGFIPDVRVTAPADIVNVFPYLEGFLPDALEHWQARRQSQLKSGPWMEQGDDDEAWALEATAICHEGRPLLLLQSLGEAFQQKQQQMQIARDNLLTQEMLEVEVRKRTADIRSREEEIAMRLVAAAVYRDEETGAHIRRIGLYSAEMGRALGWPLQEVDDILVAAPMHDIGKIGTPDQILQKPGPLDVAEFEIMKDHARIGGDMLAGTGIGLLDMASEIAHNHHERWDGSGYPAGLSAGFIPMTARVVTVVDLYDALVSKRVYKPAFSEEKSLRIMAESSGTHLDPAIHQLFLENLPAMREIRKTVRDE